MLRKSIFANSLVRLFLAKSSTLFGYNLTVAPSEIERFISKIAAPAFNKYWGTEPYRADILAAALLFASGLGYACDKTCVEVRGLRVPVVAGVKHSPAERLRIRGNGSDLKLQALEISLEGSSDVADITGLALYADSDSLTFSRENMLASAATDGKGRVLLKLDKPAETGAFWLGATLRDSIDLTHRVRFDVVSAECGGRPAGRIIKETAAHRVGVALHTKGEFDMDTARIPGLATAPDGTLLAIFDARYDSARDLQGNIDIALRRSCDGGSTWSAPQPIIDMGEYGGLPQKYNGVSDACILVDTNTGRIFVAGLWMHGVLDDEGKWVESLDGNSTTWTHQWKKRGSQPGLGIRETCQFLIVRSDDNGLTWSEPQNITASAKRPEWWLYAPAPGQGITTADGTLVFPTQGRDAQGLPFSNITFSHDGGASWTSSNPAWSNTTECNVTELSDGTLMLNMRDNRNRGNFKKNGRRICTTSDFGETWSEHPTSRKALTEPTCMASLYRHRYKDSDGKQSDIYLFVNPPEHKVRRNITLKASTDDCASWPAERHILIDETKGMGYSSVTSIGNDAVGVLYESGIADLVFVRIGLDEILGRKTNTDSNTD